MNSNLKKTIGSDLSKCLTESVKEQISDKIKVGDKLFDNMTKENCEVTKKTDTSIEVKYENGDTQEFDSDYRFDRINESNDDEDKLEIVFDINIAQAANIALNDDPNISNKIEWTSSNAIVFENDEDLLDQIKSQLEQAGITEDQYTIDNLRIDESKKDKKDETVVCKNCDDEFADSVPSWVRKTLSGLKEVSPYIFKATTEFAVNNVPDLTAWCQENGDKDCKVTNDKGGRFIKIVDPLCSKLEKLGLMQLLEASEDNEGGYSICTNIDGNLATQMYKEDKEEAIKVCKFYNKHSKRFAGKFEVWDKKLENKIFPAEENKVNEGSECKNRTFKFTVDWDDDGEGIENEITAEICVPEEVYRDGEEAIGDFLSDWLSDTYGFCHNGFSYEEISEGKEITESVKVGKSQKKLTESIETDNKFDWFLDYKGKDDVVLYADEREDEIETDRYPKHKEIEGQAAISRARKLLKDGLEGGIPVDKGKGSRAVHGFLRLGEDGKTLMIEIESNGSKNGTLVPLI